MVAAVRGMLALGGTCAVVHATMPHGVEPAAELPHPRPPHDRITALIRRYIRSEPRDLPSNSVEVFRAAGYRGPRRFDVPGRVLAPGGVFAEQTREIAVDLWTV